MIRKEVDECEYTPFPCTTNHIVYPHFLIFISPHSYAHTLSYTNTQSYTHPLSYSHSLSNPHTLSGGPKGPNHHNPSYHNPPIKPFLYIFSHPLASSFAYIPSLIHRLTLSHRYPAPLTPTHPYIHPYTHPYTHPPIHPYTLLGGPKGPNHHNPSYHPLHITLYLLYHLTSTLIYTHPPSQVVLKDLTITTLPITPFISPSSSYITSHPLSYTLTFPYTLTLSHAYPLRWSQRP